jgi:hypothetical protein
LIAGPGIGLVTNPGPPVETTISVVPACFIQSPWLCDHDAAGFRLFTQAASNLPLLFAPNNSEAVRITGAGNVGIGTATPAALLDVNGVIRSISANSIPASGVGVEIYYDPSLTSGVVQAYDRTVSPNSPDTLLLNPYTRADATDPVAGVGIGTTRVPTYGISGDATYLSIVGPIEHTQADPGSGAAGIELASNGPDVTRTIGIINFTDLQNTTTVKDAAHISVEITGSVLGNRGSDMLFATRPDNYNPTPGPFVLSPERMRITQDGLVGIGTAVPQALLEVNGVMRSTSNTPIPTSGVGVEIYYDPSLTSGVVQAYDRTAATPVDLLLNPYTRANAADPVAGVGIGTTQVPTYGISGEATYLSIVGPPESTLAPGDPGAGAGGLELASNGPDQARTVGIINFTDLKNSTPSKDVAHISGVITGSVANNRGGALVFGVRPDSYSGSPTLTAPERMRIDGITGNVGVGNTGPTYRLDISTSAVSVLRAVSSSAVNAVFALGANSTQWSWMANGTSPSAGAAGDFWLNRVGFGSVLLVQSATNYVGIGTTAPFYPLDVQALGVDIGSGGTPTAFNNVVSEFVSNDGNFSGVALGYDTRAPHIGTVAAQGAAAPTQLAFWTSIATAPAGWYERMRITGEGNVGIGTTTPQCSLDVAGLIRSTADTPGPTSGKCIEMYFHQATSTGQVDCYDYTGGAFTRLSLVGNPLILNPDATLHVGIGAFAGSPPHLFELSIDDAAKPSTNTWTIASDTRLKRNIKDLTGGLDIITRLHPIECEYNGLHGTPEGQRITGFLADEIREILPGTVKSHRGKLRETDQQETDILDFNLHEVLIHLVLAVKQLAAAQVETAGSKMK